MSIINTSIHTCVHILVSSCLFSFCMFATCVCIHVYLLVYITCTVYTNFSVYSNCNITLLTYLLNSDWPLDPLPFSLNYLRGEEDQQIIWWMDRDQQINITDSQTIQTNVITQLEHVHVSCCPSNRLNTALCNHHLQSECCMFQSHSSYRPSSHHHIGLRWPSTYMFPCLCFTNNHGLNNQQTRKPSLEVITTTLATFFTNRKITQLLLLIYQFKCRSAFLYYLSLTFVTPRSAIPAADDLVSCCGHELWTVSLIADHDLDSVEMNQHAKNLGQRSFCSTYYPDMQTRKHTHVTHTNRHSQTHTHTPDQLLVLNN